MAQAFQPVNDKAAGDAHPKLPDLDVPDGLPMLDDLARASRADALVIVVASHAARIVFRQLKELGADLSRKTFIICAKGIEPDTLKTMTEVAEEVLGESIRPRLGVLSGPSHAEEVSVGMPTTVVAASANAETAQRIQSIFFTPRFRVYTHDDVLGVELGGSLKNIIAIAAGICDGLGFGDNSRAALITRGLAEMTRLGVAMGAHAATFSGLAGMGDLIVTAGSRHSRNHNFGAMIAHGLTAEQAQREIGMVVEGINTCASAVRLAMKHKVEMPITRQVYAVLYERKPPRQAAQDLMLRDPKAETDRDRG
ncbi:MAG: NAD(P)-dependent glycerol-3-phosphate dehydrogenase [Candidatus Sumerlaeota bacterium]|nr:NAD(P)-dependent glycerol-3-phosphate dehydrogenase [Candidatus Sumerlaeota bacterium]